MYISNNVILYSLSRFVLNWFMSVASQYSVVSPVQPVGKSNQLFGRHLLRYSVTIYVYIYITIYFVFYYDFHLVSFLLYLSFLLHCVLGFSCFYYLSLCFSCIIMLCCHMA